MARMLRGKRMLEASLLNLPRKSTTRGMTAKEEANFYISAGLDKSDFEVVFISKVIGCGVVAKKNFGKGDFLLQYKGELISQSEAELREKTIYKRNKRCYLYFFKHHSKTFCIDATTTFGHFGRMINDCGDENSPNCEARKTIVNKVPYIAIFAIKDIKEGDELLYIYDKPDKLPWRREYKEKERMNNPPESDDDISHLFSDDDDDDDNDNDDISNFSDELPIIVKKMKMSDDKGDFSFDSYSDGISSLESSYEEDNQVDFGYAAESDELVNTTLHPPITTDESNNSSQPEDENEQSLFLEALCKAEKKKQFETPDKLNDSSQPDSVKLQNLFQEALSKAEKSKRQSSSREKVQETDMENIQQCEIETISKEFGDGTDGKGDSEIPKSSKKNVLNQDKQIPDISSIVECSSSSELITVPYNPRSSAGQESNATNKQTNSQALQNNKDGYSLTSMHQQLQEALPVLQSQIIEPLTVQESKAQNHQVIQVQIQDAHLQVSKTANIPNQPMQPLQLVTTQCQDTVQSEIDRLTDQLSVTLQPQQVNVDWHTGSAQAISSPSLASFGPESNSGLVSQMNIDSGEPSPVNTISYVEESGNIKLQESEQNVNDVSTNSSTTENPSGEADDETIDDTNCVKKKRPDRYCIYCKRVVPSSKLSRHIRRNHKNQDEVSAALKKSKAEQNKFFDQKRKEGIYEFNIKCLSLPTYDENSLMRERRPKYSDKTRCCTGCNVFLSNRTYYKHKQICSTLTASAVKPMLLKPVDIHKDPEFVQNILHKFREGEVGDFIRGNSVIQQVGYRHFCLRRHEKSKIDEVRKCVMTEMRELARLFLAFKSLSTDEVQVEDMFTTKNLQLLIDTVEKITEKDKGEKHGLKLTINAIILRTIKSLKGFFTQNNDDDRVKELEKFHLVYNFRSPEIFTSARYKAVSNCLDKARRPENLVEEKELIKLKNYIIAEMNNIGDNVNNQNYSDLRSLIVCRLTLYNGRRGEEPARLLLTEWQDAIEGTWLPGDMVEKIDDEAEKYLINQFKLAYLHGKGRKLVPVLIPTDLIKPIESLIKFRDDYNIPQCNPFLFATKSTGSHCSGWHAVRDICNQAGAAVNATKNRHRISTIYASLDMNAHDQKVFLEHMGHEAEINRDNYQCPIGIKTVKIMGAMLNNIDNGETSSAKKHVQVNSVTNSTEARNQRAETPSAASSTSQHTALEHNNNDVHTSDTEECNDRKQASADYSKSKSKHSAIRVGWLDGDTKLITDTFQSCFSVKKDNKGNLPKKAEILKFLTGHQLKSLEGLSTQQAYVKVRSKLFNERKTMRKNLNKNLGKLQN